MKKVILDTTFRAKLGNLQESLELCDEAGKVLGRFIPGTQSDFRFNFEPNLTEEELLKREQEPEISTAELLARLEKL